MSRDEAAALKPGQRLKWPSGGITTVVLVTPVGKDIIVRSRTQTGEVFPVDAGQLRGVEVLP